MWYSELCCARGLYRDTLPSPVNALSDGGQVLHTDGIYSDQYDPKPADIWTCGVMLYVFTTACLPFDSDNNSVLYR